MDARQNKTGVARTGGSQDHRSGPSLGRGPSALAVAVLVAVVVAAILAVVPDDGSSPRPEVSPTPATSSTIVQAGQDETGRTIYLWDPDTGDMRIVASLPVYAEDAELTPRGDRVVVERQATYARPQIFVLRADGAQRRLTHLRDGAIDPTWSPDGRTIAFSAWRGRAGEKDTDIFVMNADGSHIRRLVGTAGNDVDPDWSPDGSRIAFHGRMEDNRGGIWVASVRTGTLTRLTPRERGVGAMDPAWSPDGRWIAYSRYASWDTLNGKIWSARLWLTRSDGTGQRPITRPDANRVNENPSWSPDGRLIVFEEHNWNWRLNRVLVIDPKTRRVRSILPGYEAGARDREVAASWGQEGILMSLSNGNPAPSPGPAPPRFQVEPQRSGVDATITLQPGPGCELDADNPVPPGRLELQLVNDSHFEGGFRVTRLSPAQTLSRLRAHLQSFSFRGDRTVFPVDPSTAWVWSSGRRIVSGQWGVICYKDKIHGPHGLTIVAVGVAGLIEVGR